MTVLIGLAERWLEQALSDLRDGIDPLPALSAAEAVLRAEEGELPLEQISDLLEDGEDCTCSPELAARGGFSSSCRVCMEERTSQLSR